MSHVTVVMCPGDKGPHPVPANAIQIPDLWHIAMHLPEFEQKQVLDCWHLCHALRDHIRGAAQ